MPGCSPCNLSDIAAVRALQMPVLWRSELIEFRFFVTSVFGHLMRTKTAQTPDPTAQILRAANIATALAKRVCSDPGIFHESTHIHVLGGLRIIYPQVPKLLLDLSDFGMRNLFLVTPLFYFFERMRNDPDPTFVVGSERFFDGCLDFIPVDNIVHFTSLS